MKKKKYLPLYYEWGRRMKIPIENCNRNTGGLCGVFDDDKLFQLLKPVSRSEVETRPLWGYWGCDQENGYHVGQSDNFNPLRQNIVLLMAAMAGEL